MNSTKRRRHHERVPRARARTAVAERAGPSIADTVPTRSRRSSHRQRGSRGPDRVCTGHLHPPARIPDRRRMAHARDRRPPAALSSAPAPVPGGRAGDHVIAVLGGQVKVSVQPRSAARSSWRSRSPATSSGSCPRSRPAPLGDRHRARARRRARGTAPAFVEFIEGHPRIRGTAPPHPRGSDS